MKPRIGIDIDDVLSETCRIALEELEIRHGHSMQFEEISHFDWTQIDGFPLDFESNIEFFREILKDVGNIHKITPLDGSINAIKTLQSNFELHAITARHPSTSEATHKWIQLHYGDAFGERIDFLGLMTGHKKITKGEACELYELEVFVDDNIDYALTVTEKGIPCFLMERPWNKNRQENHPLLIRVNSWTAVTEGIHQLYGI